MAKYVEIRRYNGSTFETLYPKTHYSKIDGLPSNFVPTAHTHDDRYYTETEINSKLSGKSNVSHTHSQYLTSIPTASATTLGGIKVGSGLNIGSDGTLKILGNRVPINLGDNLRGKTIHFDTSYVSNNAWEALKLQTSSYYDFVQEWYGSGSGNSQMHFFFTDQNDILDDIDFTDQGDCSWLVDSFTFSNDQDHYVINLPTEFADFAYIEQDEEQQQQGLNITNLFVGSKLFSSPDYYNITNLGVPSSFYIDYKFLVFVFTTYPQDLPYSCVIDCDSLGGWDATYFNTPDGSIILESSGVLNINLSHISHLIRIYGIS